MGTRGHGGAGIMCCTTHMSQHPNFKRRSCCLEKTLQWCFVSCMFFLFWSLKNLIKCSLPIVCRGIRQSASCYTGGPCKKLAWPIEPHYVNEKCSMMEYTVIILSILTNVLASIQKIISNKSFQTNGLFNIIWSMTTMSRYMLLLILGWKHST